MDVSSISVPAHTVSSVTAHKEKEEGVVAYAPAKKIPKVENPIFDEKKLTELNITHLPGDVLEHIFSYCSLKDFFNLRQVCSFFERYANSYVLSSVLMTSNLSERNKFCLEIREKNMSFWNGKTFASVLEVLLKAHEPPREAIISRTKIEVCKAIRNTDMSSWDGQAFAMILEVLLKAHEPPRERTISRTKTAVCEAITNTDMSSWDGQAFAMILEVLLKAHEPPRERTISRTKTAVCEAITNTDMSSWDGQAFAMILEVLLKAHEPPRERTISRTKTAVCEAITNTDMSSWDEKSYETLIKMMRENPEDLDLQGIVFSQKQEC